VRVCVPLFHRLVARSRVNEFDLAADSPVLVPRRDPRVGDPEGAGHHRRADLHHQQRARGVPERAAAAEGGQGRQQHLRGVRAQPPRLLPLLLPRMQGACRLSHRDSVVFLCFIGHFKTPRS
jgi:hypothetical protein